jgi:hypothetical protein
MNLRVAILFMWALLAPSGALSQADAGRTLQVNSVQTVDLSRATRVDFNLPSRGTITTFSDVVPGRLYVFFFTNGNTTITNDNAHLAGRLKQLNPRAGTSILFVGENSTLIRQVADGVTSQ